MAIHNQLGEQGEQLAAAWLEKNGFEILYRNWKYWYFEIDLVAMKNNHLHIVEVKCRNATRFGNPEDAVTKKKFRNLKKAADHFLFQNPGYKWVQYDILSITMFKNKEPEYFFLEDVFL